MTGARSGGSAGHGSAAGSGQGAPAVQIPDPPGAASAGPPVPTSPAAPPTAATVAAAIGGLLTQPTVPTQAVATILALIAMLVSTGYNGLVDKDAELQAALSELRARVTVLEASQVTRGDLDALREAIRDLEQAVDGRVRSVELEQARGESRGRPAKGGGE